MEILLFLLAIIIIIFLKPTIKKKKASSQTQRAYQSDFIANNLLNSSEQKCFKLLQKKIELDYPNWYVFPQVSVGEVLKAKDFNGYAITNSKRYDFLIVDHNFKPQIAIEYDGQGHYQGNYKDNIFHQLPTTFGKTNNTAG